MNIHLIFFLRLKDKEAMLLEENKTQLQKWEMRVEETEQRYETKIRDLTSSHDSEIDSLKQKHGKDLEEQQRLRKEELCAVLSVQQTTTALKELTEKVNLSADEISSLTSKLDINRLVIRYSCSSLFIEMISSFDLWV
jgi:predicted GTPase